MTSTICVVGFPQDASMRERKNYVCFLPGFERAILTKTNTLFVKFEAQELAQQAIEILTSRKYDDDDPKSVPVSAQMAKNELAENCKQTAVPMQGGGYPLAAAPAPAVLSFAPPAAYGKGGYAPSAGKGKVVAPGAFGKGAAQPWGGAADWGYTDPGQAAWGAQKRQRTAQEPTEIFTLAVLGMKSKGLNGQMVSEAFKFTPGFVGEKASPPTDGIFGKFETPQHAQDAIVSLESQGIKAEMARRNADW